MFVRNEARVLARTLRHLHEQGVEVCLLDHGSTDETLEIAAAFEGRGVCRLVREPYDGTFDLESLLRRIESLVAETHADWCLLQGADEIREAPDPFPTLAAGFEAADRAGYNAIQFDEFVFCPTSEDESFTGTDFVERMEHYY